MKKLLQPSILIILVLLVITSSFKLEKVTTSKIGYLSINGAVSRIPIYQQQRSKLDTTIYELNLALQEKIQDFQQKQQSFVKDSASLNELIRQDKLTELQNLSQAIQAFKQGSEEEVARQDSILVQPILDELQLAIKEVAKQHGYTHILNTDVRAVNGPPMVLYAHEETNVTDLVIETFEQIPKSQ